MNAILNTAISPFVLIMRRSGLLTDLPRLTQGRGLTLRPAMTLGGGIPGPGKDVDGTGDPSLDVYQQLGPNLLSAVSINTSWPLGSGV